MASCKDWMEEYEENAPEGMIPCHSMTQRFSMAGATQACQSAGLIYGITRRAYGKKLKSHRIMADQCVKKVSKDEYLTLMEGLKFKIGHRRPYWKNWSYTYPEQPTYRQKLIGILRQTLQQLEADEAAAIKVQLPPPAQLIMQQAMVRA